MKRVRRIMIWLLVLALLALLGLLLFGHAQRHPEDLPWTPLDLAQPVETLMTSQPRTLDLEQTIRDAIELMQTGRYRNVPVIDDAGRLAGVVRQSDLLKYLAESFPEELLILPPRSHQRLRAPEGA